MANEQRNRREVPAICNGVQPASSVSLTFASCCIKYSAISKCPPDTELKKCKRWLQNNVDCLITCGDYNGFQLSGPPAQCNGVRSSYSNSHLANTDQIHILFTVHHKKLAHLILWSYSFGFHLNNALNVIELSFQCSSMNVHALSHVDSHYRVMIMEPT